MRSPTLPAAALLWPSLAAAAQPTPTDPGTPLLWLWIVLGVGLMAVMVALLFSSSGRHVARRNRRAA